MFPFHREGTLRPELRLLVQGQVAESGVEPGFDPGHWSLGFRTALELREYQRNPFWMSGLFVSSLYFSILKSTFL